MANEEEIRRQLIDAYEGADYPANSPMDLVPALPEGPKTEFSSGDFSMTAMELHTQVTGCQFPYETVEEVADDITKSLKEEFPEHFRNPSSGNLPDWFSRQRHYDDVDGQSVDNPDDTELYSEG